MNISVLGSNVSRLVCPHPESRITAVDAKHDVELVRERAELIARGGVYDVQRNVCA